MEKRTIYAALAAVQADLSKVGIEKNQRNDHGKYNFRGIDDVLNTLAPILSAHGVLIMPSVVSCKVEMITTSGGKPSRAAEVAVDYHIYDKHGDSIVHRSIGEAFDTSDKAVNKAMTAAYKYFLFQAFCIPVHGTDDADAESPEVAVTTLSANQISELEYIVNQLHDPASFYTWLKVPIEQVEASRFGSLKKMLTTKASREYEASAKAAAQADMIGEEIPDGQ